MTMKGNNSNTGRTVNSSKRRRKIKVNMSRSGRKIKKSKGMKKKTLTTKERFEGKNVNNEPGREINNIIHAVGTK
jgi:hypothetical protein